MPETSAPPTAGPVPTPAAGHRPATDADTDTAVTVTVRYFAAARAAAGTESEAVTVPSPATVRRATTAMIQAHGDGLARVLARCSFLLDAVAVHDAETPLTAGAQLDVLPPFAGG